MKKTEIIKSSRDFTAIIKNERFYKNDSFIIYKRKTDVDFPKFGITISTKSGNAVVRNKLKRQVKSIIDHNKKLFSNNQEYIIMIRVKCVNSAYQDLENKLVSLVVEKVEK